MNNQIRYLLLILSLGLAFPFTTTFAEEEVYGWQIMTEQEKHEYRTKMQHMTTTEERQQYQMQHHIIMEKRAMEQNIKLHDGPQNKNRMMDNHAPNTGMGTGGGMGSGGGR